MLRVRRSALPALALVLAGVLSGCSDPAEEAPTASVTPSEPVQPSESAHSTDPPAAPKNLITVTIAGDKITPGPGKVKVPLGEKVTVEVTADVAEEVHVHGYDTTVELKPGELATLTFKADIPGVFEAELEGSGKLLFELEVK